MMCTYIHILTHILSSCSPGTSFAISFDRDFSERVARPIKMKLVPGLWIRPGLNFRDRHHKSTSVAEQRGGRMGGNRDVRLRQAQPPHIKGGASLFELLLGWVEKSPALPLLSAMNENRRVPWKPNSDKKRGFWAEWGRRKRRSDCLHMRLF